MQFELTLNFDYIDTTVRLKIVIRIFFCRIAIITLIGYWRFTGTPTQTVLTVGNNETKPLRPDSLLGELTSESRIREAKESPEVESFTIFHCE